MYKLFIADDEAIIREGLRCLLDWETLGFTIAGEAANGDAALQFLLSETPDLVLLDIRMPGMSGLDVVRIAREHGYDGKVVILSGYSDFNYARTAIRYGVLSYLTKPIDEEEMLWRIKALLRRAKIASERRIVVGDVVLDYDCLTVSRKGEVQELPQKEFLLLYKLLSYPGKIFTRIQLMDEIWGADSDTGWETVTVHVGRLRKRFQDWPEFTIESVRGLGYKAVKKV